MAEDSRVVAKQIAAQCLILRVRRLDRQLTRIYDDALRAHGMTAAQLNLLVAITVAAPIAPSALAAAMELEKSSLSRNVAKMVEHGWVSSSSRNDGRLMLSVTAKGSRVLEKAHAAWAEAQASARELLGEDVSARLAALPPRPKARP